MKKNYLAKSNIHLRQKLLQPDKRFDFQNLRSNVTLNGECLHAFIPTLETRQGCLLSPLVSKIVIDVLTSAIRQEKETKGMQIRKEEIKLYYSMI